MCAIICYIQSFTKAGDDEFCVQHVYGTSHIGDSTEKGTHSIEKLSIALHHNFHLSLSSCF